MKIISKDSVEIQKTVQRAKPRHRTSTEPKLSKKSIVITDATDPIAKRKAHLQREKLRREVIRNKKKKPLVKEKKPFMEGQLDQFMSLIRFNITFKLTLGYTFRLVGIILFLFIGVYLAFSYFLFHNAQLQLNENASFIETYLSNESNQETELLKQYLDSESVHLYLFDDSKTMTYASSGQSIDYATATQTTGYDFRTFPSFQNLFTYGLYQNENAQTGYYTLEKEMTSYKNVIEATFPIGIVLCIVLILSSIISAGKMSNKHLRPIHTMTEQVKDMSANNLSTRLNLGGTKDELKDLAHTFNKMLDDIQKSYEREKQFVSDASHELRTPIAVIKGYAGMLNRWGKDDPDILEESIQAIMGETDNMQSLVESLLFIARNDKGTLKMDLETFNLSDLLHEVVKETRMIDSQHKIQDQIEDALMVYGSLDKLKQAFRIFIDNSIKYTLDDGEIKITLKSSARHHIIIFEDNGIGISEEDLPHVFDRFYRADKSRTKMKANQHGGTGLGLSIAKIIIEQHGGRIQVDSTLNIGTRFSLFIPKILEEARD